MAPAQPLRLAQVAVTRRTAEGRVAGADEALSLEGAMRAITIGGARLLRMEDEIGSIAPGKRADFTVLAEDPYEVDPERLADIPIWGTVFEGVAHPLVAGDGDEHSAKCSAAPLGAAGYE